MKNLLLFLLFSILISSCSSSSPETSLEKGEDVNLGNSIVEEVEFKNSNSDESSLKLDVANPSYSVSNSSSQSNEVATANSKIIKTGSIVLKTDKISRSKAEFDLKLKSLGAYYENEELSSSDEQINYQLTIRIPASKFDLLLNFIGNSKDEITYKSIQSRDVTEEYEDVEVRLANKRAYLKRYQEILTKANSIKDILEVEEHIRSLEEEIESKIGRLNYLKDQISLSTLNVNLFEEKAFIYKPGKEESFFEKMKKSIHSGWRGIVQFLLIVLNAWPFILISIVGFVFWRRRKARKNTLISGTKK